MFSHINYMAVVWVTANKCVTKQINKIIKLCARIYYRKRRYDPVPTLIKSELEWLSSNEVFIKAVLCHLYKILKSCPHKARELITLQTIEHNYNLRTCDQLRLLRTNNKSGERSFEYTAIKNWTPICVPNRLHEFKFYDLFSESLHNVLLDNTTSLVEAPNAQH